MNIHRAVFASARADFLERVRRYSFLFTLGLALYFGYLAAVGRIMLRLNDARGVYNSAWVGALLTIVGSTFISLAGFYFVKNTIQRDRETRVGEILASAPLSKVPYILSKVLHLLFPIRPLHWHLPYPLLYPCIRLRRSRSP